MRVVKVCPLLLLLCFIILLSCENKNENSKIYITVKKTDSLKQNYLFDELNVLIKSLDEKYLYDPRIKYIIADWAYFQMDYKKADSLFDEILKDYPRNINAINGKALIALDNWDTIQSLKLLERALQIDSASVCTQLNYANVNLKAGNSKKYISIIDEVLKVDSLNSDALYGKGHYLCRYRHDIKNGVRYLNKAIETNPLNRKAHNFLGRGYSLSGYKQENIFDKKFARIDSLLRNNQFDLANALAKEKYLKDTSNVNALKLLAATEFHLGRYTQCINYSFKILQLKPNYGLAHYFISESLIKKEEKYNLLQAKYKLKFLTKNSVDSIPYLDKVFINYHQCDTLLQKSIKINISPLKGFMEALFISGATIYFKDFHHLLWNCPFLENTKGTYTADLRLVDDIGGQGGYHTSSEKLLQTASVYGGYNIAFHEIAHLIHWLLPKNELDELKQLFIQAKEGNYTLDWYAALNEREYFAQGVEAYLSDNKLPRQSAEYSNTKEILLKKDRKLFDFIEKLINKKSYNEYVVQAYILKSQYAETSELALMCLQDGLSAFPGNANLLIELGNTYLFEGDFQKAIQIHKEVLKNNSYNIYALVVLSFDLFKMNNSAAESIRLLKPFYYKRPQDNDLCLYLGYYYVMNKDFQAAIELLERVVEHDPFPDPYSTPVADAFYLLGKCNLEISQFQTAEKYLVKCVATNGVNIDAYADLIMVEMNLKKREEARKYFETMKQLNPTDSRISSINKLVND